MGVCASAPKANGCVMVGSGLQLRKKINRRRRRRRRDKTQSSQNKLSKVEPSHPPDFSFSNPTYQGNADTWHDPDTLVDSGSEDDGDEFYSVQDDISQLGSANVTPRCSDVNHHFAAATSDPPTRSSESSSFTNTDIDSRVSPSKNTRPKFELQSNNDQREVEGPGHGDKDSALRLDTSDEGNKLLNCGLLPNAILPCLPCSSSSEEALKPQRLHLTSMKKRPSFKLSFKKREDQAASSLLSSRIILQRPVAGSQIPSCPLEKGTTQCWSRIPPSSFRVRGPNYSKDKKKEYAPNCEAFYPFGVDVFFSPRKIDHIARFVELPSINSSSEFPGMLVVNLQIPLYPASLFQNEYDGEGLNYVFYFKLSDNYSKELPVRFQENFRKIIDGEVEKIRGFAVDTSAPFRERLKILGRVVNVDDLHLTATEKKLMTSYNEKPVLSRPQHQFYLGENYFEIDLDIHRFSYIARKGFESFFDRVKHCVLDFGLTIQGNKPDELPECMLCCLRLKEIDYTNANQLSV